MYIQNLLRLQAGIVLSLMVMAGESSAQTYDPAFDLAIRKAIPQPARCEITPQPLFYCRFDNAFEGSVVLELSATKEGPSASLTYNYGDPKSAELLAIVRGFFGSVGVDTKSFASCIRQSHTVPGEMNVGDLTLTCRYADLGDRVTYEVFAHRRPEASPSPFLLAGSEPDRQIRSGTRITADELTNALIPYAKGEYTRAIDLLAPLAERGDPVAQLRLGVLYSSGRGVERNGFVALSWFAKAAEQGQSQAMLLLGKAYRDGLGTVVNGALAIHWLKAAAERGVPEAFNALGELYLGHWDVPPNEDIALEWFFRGASLDSSAAMYNIGMRYALGPGPRHDDIEAYKWFELAADAGLGDERDRAIAARSTVGERLTPLQVWTAKIEAQEWITAGGPAIASPRTPHMAQSRTETTGPTHRD